jgi:hypothetical protein
MTFYEVVYKKKVPINPILKPIKKATYFVFIIRGTWLLLK